MAIPDIVLVSTLLCVLYILILIVITRNLYEKATSQAVGSSSITWDFVRRLPMKLRPFILALIIVVWPLYAVIMLIVGLSIFITVIPELLRDFFDEMRAGINRS